MKSAFKSFQIVLLLCGVFGAKEDEVSVSVMEGDSVTLHTNLTQIKKFYLIEWRFGDPVIAQIDGNDISYPKPTEMFRDRLQLDQTGSLTIKNIKTKHSGLYELQIRHSDGTLDEKFNVTVYESPSASDAGKAEMKSFSLKEGDSVTLQTDVSELHGDELIVWRFGDEGKLIAKADIEAKSSPLYDTDERFRDRLKLDHQTGSLIITNTRNTDSGFYEVKISSNKQTLYKRFTVAVAVAVAVSEPGLSSAAAAGIGVVVVLLVAAAAVVGVIYHRRKISELQKQTLTVLEGEDVTLYPNTAIQPGDWFQWRFGDEETLIAELKGETREITIYDVPDERFKDILVLDEETGSLTIWDITAEHTGNYSLKITRGRETLYNRFKVYIKDEVRNIAVMEGESVTLKHATALNKDDVIQWLFEDEKQLTGIAEFSGKTGEIFPYDDVADERFSDRLDLDKTTGSLTIKNTRTAHSGLYKLEIRSSRRALQQRFFVTVNEKVELKLLKEDSVTLDSDTEIQRDDQILWMFGDQENLIAQIKGGTGERYDGDDGRFRGRLKLDEKTGSLTITNITPKHTGLYKLLIISSSSRRILYKKFKVLIQIRYEAVTAGDPVHLYTGLPKMETNDVIQWMFGDENSLIAEIKGGNGETYDGPDGRFRDRLKLNNQTGALTIKNSTAEHTGHYNLKICSSKGNTYRTYVVIIRERTKSLIKEKNDSTGKRVNESAAVEIPLQNVDPDGVHEQEGTSLL